MKRRMAALLPLSCFLLLIQFVSATNLARDLHSHQLVFASRFTNIPEKNDVFRLQDEEHWLLTAFGEHFDIKLSRNRDFIAKSYKKFVIDHVADDFYALDEENHAHCHFLGSINGTDRHVQSYAALSLCHGQFHGEIVVGENHFFIEPHSVHFSAQASQKAREDCDLHHDCKIHQEHVAKRRGSAIHEKFKHLPHVAYKPEHLRSVRMECGSGESVNSTRKNSPHHFGGLADIEHQIKHHHSLQGSYGDRQNSSSGHFQGMYTADVKYVELAIYNDYKRYTSKSSYAAAVLYNSEVLVHIVHTRYLLNSFSPMIRVILVAQAVMISADPWGVPKDCATPVYAGAIDHSDLLDKFTAWVYTTDAATKISYIPWDNAHLLSGYNFCGYSVGFAPVGTMCTNLNSVGISQPLFSDQQSANIITHEMGHNFNMMHDSTGNACPESGFIMAAVADLTSPKYLTQFSTCSKTYYNNLMMYRPSGTSCLDNLPETRYNESCGDGWIGVGEQCDCGSNDCSKIDPCCNGATCQLIDGAECSSLDQCCTPSCQIIAAGAKVCRPAFHSACDMEEKCNGISAGCPMDLYKAPGTACQDSGSGGKCYKGACLTLNSQCKALYDSSITGSCFSGSQASICGQQLTCNSAQVGGCAQYPPTWVDGTDCLSGQCYNGQCKPSSTLNFMWDTLCTQNCSSPTVTKSIVCRDYAGNVFADSFCSYLGAKPTTARPCNSFAPQICFVNITTSTGSSTVAAGNNITVDWKNLFPVDWIMIVSYSSKYRWPVYLVLGAPDKGNYVYTIPPAFDSGVSVPQLWVAANVNRNLSAINVTEGCISNPIQCVEGGTCTDGACSCPSGFTGSDCSIPYRFGQTAGCKTWRMGTSCQFMFANLTVYHNTSESNIFDTSSIVGSTSNLSEKRRFAKMFLQELTMLTSVPVSQLFVDIARISQTVDGLLAVTFVLTGTDSSTSGMESLIVSVNNSLYSFSGNASRLIISRHLSLNVAMTIEGDNLFVKPTLLSRLTNWFVENLKIILPVLFISLGLLGALMYWKRRNSNQEIGRYHYKKEVQGPSPESRIPCPACKKTFPEGDKFKVHLEKCFQSQELVQSPRKPSRTQSVVKVPCPLCKKQISKDLINAHIDQCMEKRSEDEKSHAPGVSKASRSIDHEEMPPDRRIAKKSIHEKKSGISVPCPMCSRRFPEDKINEHIDHCLESGFLVEEEAECPLCKRKFSPDIINGHVNHCLGADE